MISSGESLLDVAKQLKSKGAKRIFAFASFGLFTDGYDKFDEAYRDGTISRVFTTNTVYRSPELLARPWYCEVNMCKYTAYFIDTMNHDGSISGLLNPVNRINALMERHRKELENAPGTQMQMDI
jgi:ribose-phosphate pyrophosphokinase